MRLSSRFVFKKVPLLSTPLSFHAGYGARWLAILSDSGSKNDRPVLKFRGFVEPMMENGHEVGWKH